MATVKRARIPKGGRRVLASDHPARCGRIGPPARRIRLLPTRVVPEHHHHRSALDAALERTEAPLTIEGGASCLLDIANEGCPSTGELLASYPSPRRASAPRRDTYLCPTSKSKPAQMPCEPKAFVMEAAQLLELPSSQLRPRPKESGDAGVPSSPLEHEIVVVQRSEVGRKLFHTCSASSRHASGQTALGHARPSSQSAGTPVASEPSSRFSSSYRTIFPSRTV